MDLCSLEDEDVEIPSSQMSSQLMRPSVIENAVPGKKPKILVRRGLARIVGVNLRRKALMKSRLAVKKAVSRKFNYVSEERIQDLQRICLKPNSESKVNWGVNAYNEWREDRLRRFQYNVGIYFADLNDLKSLEKQNLSHVLCRFIPEVTKQKGDGPYPGCTLYQLVTVIQKYLHVNKLLWQIVDGVTYDFQDVRTVLDNVMKERTAQNIGVKKHQANLITYEKEDKLWSNGVLGEDTPEKLRNTVLFLIGMNVLLRAVDEHYNLRHDMPTEQSQLQFERDPDGVKCLVYREDFVSKTHDGGIADRKSDRKEVWVYPDENPQHCPVRLVQKYLSLCPLYFKKANFYLQVKQKISRKQWYAEQVIGTDTISKIVKELMKEAEIPGFFTNHSLRRSGGTRCIRAGIDRKIVKEITGHKSDTVDAYQITGHEQRKIVSAVIRGQNDDRKVEKIDQVDTSEGEQKKNETRSEDCKCLCGLVNTSNVMEIVSKIIKEVGKTGKTIIKLQIEVHND